MSVAFAVVNMLINSFFLGTAVLQNKWIKWFRYISALDYAWQVSMCRAWTEICWNWSTSAFSWVEAVPLNSATVTNACERGKIILTATPRQYIQIQRYKIKCAGCTAQPAEQPWVAGAKRDNSHANRMARWCETSLVPRYLCLDENALKQWAQRYWCCGFTHQRACSSCIWCDERPCCLVSHSQHSNIRPVSLGMGFWNFQRIRSGRCSKTSRSARML